MNMKLLCCLFSFFILSPVFADGTPEIDFDIAAKKKIDSLGNVYLVSLIKSFRQNGTIYTAGRIVKIYKGDTIPCYSVVIFRARGSNLPTNEEIAEHNGRVVIVGIENCKEAVLLGEENQYKNTPQLVSLTQEIPPCAGLYFLPDYVSCYDIAETQFGNAMYNLLDR